MTDEQINIAIAEACGIASEDKWGSLYHTDHGYVRDCPDYCNDLNAMHEAEKSLSKSLVNQLTYLRKLSPILSSWTLATSTAHQRAAAFLRTLDLWKE